MKTHWHEQIQRYLAGGSTREETVALQQALGDDAELRALYLDYLNLDVALSAAAEAATLADNGIAPISTFSRSSPAASPHRWRFVAAAAACVALALLAVLPRHRDSSRVPPDLLATISSTQTAIARLSLEPASSIPPWMSPTASMLDSPEISK